MRLPANWKQPLAENRLLILSPFAMSLRRVTTETSQTRNLFVAALAGQILVVHAATGSMTEVFFRQALTWDKPIWTLHSSENENLLAAGARPMSPEEIAKLGPSKDLWLSFDQPARICPNRMNPDGERTCERGSKLRGTH